MEFWNAWDQLDGEQKQEVADLIYGMVWAHANGQLFEYRRLRRDLSRLSLAVCGQPDLLPRAFDTVLARYEAVVTHLPPLT